MRLLILGCSTRKRPGVADLSALERYDGPAFRVLRKFLSARETNSKIHLCILSAQFGLINGEVLVPLYNRRMTPHRAQELRADVIAALAEQLHTQSFESVFFDLGSGYWSALEGWRECMPLLTHVIIAQGSSGRRAALLHEWLWGKPDSIRPLTRAPEAIRLGGHTWPLKRDEVLEVARRRLRQCDVNGDLTPARFHSWCVRVDGRSVAPKWLVSQVTGLPTSKFHTEQACRALSQWGLAVERQSLLEGASEKISEKFTTEV